MAKLNREDPEDARKLVERLIPEPANRQAFINFLGNAISVADSLNRTNWNLNLDKQGAFLRFNVGQEYCIDIKHDRLLIICDRTELKRIPGTGVLPITYMGWDKAMKKKVYAMVPDGLPNMLSKTKNNIACLFDPSSAFHGHIGKLQHSCHAFIRGAILTRILPQMRRAHSPGVVDYIFSEFEEGVDDALPRLEMIRMLEAAQLKDAMEMSHAERLEKLKHAPRKPEEIRVEHFIHQRNQLVVAEVLFRANGQCEACKQRAPFKRKGDGTPYLEVHHKHMLADDGDDTVENAIALCPNCHRQAHFG